jgi:hypothetical protein
MLFTQTELLHSLLLFLLAGGFAGLVFGVMMLSRPDWIVALNIRANRWISTRKLLEPLQQPINIDRTFYRHGYWFGSLLAIGALYIIYIFTTAIGREALLESLAGMKLVPLIVQQPVLDSLVFISLAGALLGLIVSLFLILRPSMLRDLELGANANFTLRKTLKPVEIQYAALDGWVFGSARIAGVLILGGSLYSIVGLAFWLSR